MRIYVIGTRGFPHIQGGVEKHCESLYPLMAERGCRVKVFRREPYINKHNDFKMFRSVHFHDLHSPGHKNFETIIHSLVAAVICLCEKPDIVHIHNIGPSLILPLLKLGRLNTIVTYHSPNYEHGKWGFFAKKILMLGEKFVSRWADKVIFVSKTAFRSVDCISKIHIPNGVKSETPSSSWEFLAKSGIYPDKYVLAVGRLTPEKGLIDLVAAFKDMNCDYQLVIAGNADHETDYSRNLRRMAEADARIILTGYVTGEPLNQLYSHARLFLLPSYHEGLPIVLLEAMSFGLSVLVSDIPANREVGLSPDRYFRCGDVADLKEKMETLLKTRLTKAEQQGIRDRIAEKYDWEKIADQTLSVYEKVA